MRLTIGYYVHHHGMGHLSRALAIAPYLSGQLTLLGTGLAGKCADTAYVELPDDRNPPGQNAKHLPPPALHYAPLDCEGIRQRAAVLTAWVASHRPNILVVDVSVEVAMLARLASTPVLYVRLNGDRNDTAHMQAFAGAQALLAPFHQALDDPGTPAWVRQKTRYIPGLTPPMPEVTPRPGTILLVLGAGGTAITGEQIAAAAAATPQFKWRVIGPALLMPDTPANLCCVGWVTDPAAEIAGAEIIIGAAGDGVVNAILAAARPFICLPQPRPYDEQFAKARRLGAMGAAITLEHWPADAQWQSIITEARALNPCASRRLHDAQGARRMAEFITELARQ